MNAEKGFLKAIEVTKEPTPNNAVSNTSLAVTVLASFAGGPAGATVAIYSFAFSALEVIRYGNSDKYKTLRQEYTKFMADTKNSILFMQTEAKTVLELKAKAESNTELPEA